CLRPRRFPSWRRLKGADFARILGERVSASAGCLVLFGSRKTEQIPGKATGRLGLAVGRSVGNAVVRNRVKRRLRSVFRQELAVNQGLDVVIRVRPAA